MSSKQSPTFTIVWSPNNTDRFLKFTSKQIELYEIKSNENEENIINTQYNKIFTYNETDNIKCLSWQMTKYFERSSNSVDLLALGLSTGVIKTISLGDTSFESEESYLADKELKPKGIRQSIFLEWNPWQRSMLAQGIDKSKGSWGIEASILLWEIQKDGLNRAVSGTSSQHSNQQNYAVNFNVNSNTQTKVNTELVLDQPIFEYCRNEVVNSFAWINQSRFICGVNNKALKIFETTGIQCIKLVLTDAVYGLCLNLCQQNILASFNDDKILIWKEDVPEKPVLTYMEDNFIETIEWSPLRDGYLCVTFRDKPFIKVLDVKIALINISHELEHLIIDRVLKASDESIIISAAWHKKIENCILLYLEDDRIEILYLKNRRVAPWSVQQRFLVNMDSYIHIIYFKKEMSSASDLSGNNIEQFSNDKNISNEMVDSIDVSQEYMKHDQYNFFDNDINSVMKERALCGYGLKSPSKESSYSSMFKDNLELKTFWKWIEDTIVNSCNFDSYAFKSKINTFCGVIECIRDVVKVSSNSANFESMFQLNHSVSVAEEVKWDNIYDVLPFPKYTHEFRDKIFRVCDWPFHKKNSEWRSHLESINNKERAAAIAIVTLNFDLALQYLKRITNDKGLDNEMLRLCLAGFNTQSGQSSNSYWSSICRDMLIRLGNSRPYLKLIFNFLIINNKHDLQFIKTSNILLLDKLAIAALYMDDENLVDFLNYIASTHLKCGDLEAVVITGLRSSEFIDLLQAYCDRTFDTQTAAIAVLQTNILTKNALGKSKVSSQWIENYRHFLDNWNLWFIRADFDIINQYLNFSSNAEVPTKLQKQPSYNLQISKTGHTALKPPIQNEVYVACNYCYGKISQSSKYINSPYSGGLVSKTRSDGSGFGNTTVSSVSMHAGGCKATICQNCRKPLPRCSVCLMNMGTACDSNKGQTANVTMFSSKDDQITSNPIWSWFIWCQKCKHGGHSGHLQSWFLEWDECPVSGCKCFCSYLDSSFSLFTECFHKIEQFNSE